MSFVESLPAEYSYAQVPSVSHENSTSELLEEKPLQVNIEFLHRHRWFVSTVVFVIVIQVPKAVRA